MKNPFRALRKHCKKRYKKCYGCKHYIMCKDILNRYDLLAMSPMNWSDKTVDHAWRLVRKLMV